MGPWGLRMILDQWSREIQMPDKSLSDIPVNACRCWSNLQSGIAFGVSSEDRRRSSTRLCIAPLKRLERDHFLDSSFTLTQRTGPKDTYDGARSDSVGDGGVYVLVWPDARDMISQASERLTSARKPPHRHGFRYSALRDQRMLFPRSVFVQQSPRRAREPSPVSFPPCAPSA